MDGIDIGHGVRIYWTVAEDPDVRVGLIEEHDSPSGRCAGNVFFRGRVPDDCHPAWTIESEDPLTLSPSILCRTCGHHGFIRGGRWVPA